MHPYKNIASEAADVYIEGIPGLLQRHGYRTLHFTGSDPDWDGQRTWLERWYQAYAGDDLVQATELAHVDVAVTLEAARLAGALELLMVAPRRVADSSARDLDPRG